jgi:cytoskeletal protein CcmA (bactofilin family)
MPYIGKQPATISAVSVDTDTGTFSGQVAAASLDISGNVDVDGVLETDGISIASTTITSTAAELNILDGVTASAADINLIDGITNGTVIASKAIITDANKDISGGRNITISGELDAATLDISGDADIDGTLEADAITVNGTALNTVIAGVTVANATLAATTTVTNSTANTNFPVVFHDESNALLDDTGALRYNPSTGELLVPKLTVAGVTTTADTVTMQAANAVVFEGATADAHETTLTITDPTADRTITLPNVSGTLPILAADSNTAITSTPAELNILDGATVVVGEINALDLGSTAVGTAIASKAVILDSNKDYTGIRNFTISGELDAGSLDISGDIDVDGTTNLDVVDIDGAVNMATTALVTGVLTTTATAVFNGGFTSNGDTNTFTSSAQDDPVIVLENTTNDSNSARFKFRKNRGGAGQDGDDIADILFNSLNDAQEETNFASIYSEIIDASNGTEDGKFRIETMLAGTNTISRMEFNSAEAIFNQGGVDLDFRVESNGNANMLFVEGGTDRVGIGLNAPLATLHVDQPSTTAPSLTGGAASGTILQMEDFEFSLGLSNASPYPLFIQGRTANTGASSAKDIVLQPLGGHVHVATTSTNQANVGISLNDNGNITAARDGGTVGTFNRKSSNGYIVVFNKDQTENGKIVIKDGTICIGSGDSLLRFNYGSGSAIVPVNLAGDLNDNQLDLGEGSARFDDIFATNGTIQTSDRNEKQDIEELTDAEKRVAVVAKGLMRKFRWKDKVAEKGDNARTHFGIIAQDLQDAFTAESLDVSKYAMFCSDTWWEKEISVDAVEADEEKGIEAKDAYTYMDSKQEATTGYTEKTRLGVRYSELLAFIISAI